MSTSRIPAVIDALVSTLRTALPSAEVFDGQWTTVPDGDYVTVGWTPDGDLPTGQQDWQSLGNHARTETIDVPCYVDSYSGSTNASARRTAAFGLLATIENTIRTDPTLGGVVPQPGWAEIGQYTVRQEQTEAGDAVGIVFHVHITTRI